MSNTENTNSHRITPPIPTFVLLALMGRDRFYAKHTFLGNVFPRELMLSNQSMPQVKLPLELPFC